VYGYRVKDKRTMRVRDEVELHLPAMEYQTVACWLELPPTLPKSLFPPHEQERYDRGGLHAIEHLLISLAPLELFCEPSDWSCQHTRRDTDLNRLKLLLFETARGGMGLSTQMAGALGKLLRSAQKIVSKCPCENGCLECILLPSCYEDGLDKEAANIILQALVGGLREQFSSCMGEAISGE